MPLKSLITSIALIIKWFFSCVSLNSLTYLERFSIVFLVSFLIAILYLTCLVILDFFQLIPLEHSFVFLPLVSSFVKSTNSNTFSGMLFTSFASVLLFASCTASICAFVITHWGSITHNSNCPNSSCSQSLLLCNNIFVTFHITIHNGVMCY